MKAPPRIAVLEERRAVEIDERVLVGGEVTGDPIEDDADVGLVQRSSRSSRTPTIRRRGAR
jgi:hypothetical protein